jgi:septum formation protein
MTLSSLERLANAVPFVLGSGSPRRRRLLGETGIAFTVLIADVDERQRDDESPYDCALRLAREKALSVDLETVAGAVTLGCDTIVVLEQKILPKPESEEEAFDTLRQLAGRQHTVCSALALAYNREVVAAGYETTEVWFNAVTDGRIREYIVTGEPMDKAGAYGIQGMGGFLVDRIDGNLDTVIGLPQTLLERLAGEVFSKLRLAKD